MNDDELQAIRERWPYVQCHSDLPGTDIAALLAEVERLRALLSPGGNVPPPRIGFCGRAHGKTAFAKHMAEVAERWPPGSAPPDGIVPLYEAPREPGDAPTPAPAQDAFGGPDEAAGSDGSVDSRGLHGPGMGRGDYEHEGRKADVRRERRDAEVSRTGRGAFGKPLAKWREHG